MKVGQIYNIPAFQAFCDSAKNKPHHFTDSPSGLVLQRNLTQVDPTILEKRFPELSFVNSGIQVDNTGGFARRIQSLRTRPLGSFRNSDDKADNKGKISLSAETNDILVIARESESEWSDTDVKTAELENRNLPQEFVAGHNQIFQREIDQIGYVGFDDSSGNLLQEGLLNSPAWDTDTAANSVDNLTSIEMYNEIANLIKAQKDKVQNTPEYQATNVDMPVRVFNKIQQTILDTAGGMGSVLDALRRNFPEVTFNATFRAEDVGGSSVTVAYSNSREAMVMRVPEPLTIGEIIRTSSFHFHVESRYRVGGLDVLEANGARLKTGL